MKLSEDRKQHFCEALAKGLTTEGAAKSVGISRTTAHAWRKADAAFAVRWTEAVERKIETIESVLFRAAKRGEPWAVCFFLKSNKPDLYNRRTLVLEGNPDAPMQSEHRMRGEIKVMIYPRRREGEP